MWSDPADRADTASATFLLLWAMVLGLLTVMFGGVVHYFSW